MEKKINKDIDRIKQLMFKDKKNDESEEESNSVEMEFSEEDEVSSSAGASAGYPTVTKWESGVTRGKANTLL